MTVPLSTVTISLLEKAAVDNGFDHALPDQGDWLVFRSTHSPLQVWLGRTEEELLLAAFSRQNVARALAELGNALPEPLPRGARGGRAVADIAGLHRLLRRAFQLGKTLPDELLHAFERE